MKARRDADPEADRARCKAYRDKDPKATRERKMASDMRCADRVKASAARYYAENRERIKARVRAYAENNSDVVRVRAKAYYEKNKAHLIEKMAAYIKVNPHIKRRAQRNYYERNAEAIAAKNFAYRSAYPEKHAAWALARYHRDPKYRALNVRRRAVKLQRTKLHNPELLALVEIEAFRVAKLREEVTGVKWEVDHTIPLQSPIVSGLHNEFNLRVITRFENRSKNNRHWPDMP